MHGHLSQHARRLRRRHSRTLRDYSSTRRPGLYGRSESQCARWAGATWRDWCGRLPSQFAQDILYSTRRRRTRNGTDRRCCASCAFPFKSSSISAAECRTTINRTSQRGAIRQREHLAHLVDVHLDDGRARFEESNGSCDSECQLCHEAFEHALPRSLCESQRSMRARMHHRLPWIRTDCWH